LPAAVGRDEHDVGIFQRSNDGLHRWITRDAVPLLKIQQRLKMNPGGGGKVALGNARQATGTTALPGRNPVF